jgi:hypothetical protein
MDAARCFVGPRIERETAGAVCRAPEILAKISEISGKTPEIEG